MPAGSGTHGAIAGAASMSKRKRHNPKVLKGKKHKMDREQNTPPAGGGGPTRIYYA